jgi:twitching motility two-component system response regulator PilG
MRVLIADDDAMAARAVATVLLKAGYQAEVAPDGRKALDRLSADRFDVLLCDWMMPDIDGTVVVRQVHGAPGSKPLMILVSAITGAPARAHALRVGADDYLEKPLTRDGLLGAIKSGLAKRARPAKKEAVPALGRDDALLGTATWRSLRDTLHDVVVDATGVLFSCGGGAAEGTPPRGDAVRACLTMVDAHHMIEVVAGIFAAEPSAAALARVMLRDPAPSEATERELLGELCNNVLGALKTSLLREGYRFTLRLAEAAPAPCRADFVQSLATVSAHEFSAKGARLMVAIGARSSPSVVVTADQLRENMVVAENLFNDAGLLIMAAGNRLSESAAERIARHLPRRTVRICAAGG